MFRTKSKNGVCTVITPCTLQFFGHTMSSSTKFGDLGAGKSPSPPASASLERQVKKGVTFTLELPEEASRSWNSTPHYVGCAWKRRIHVWRTSTRRPHSDPDNPLCDGFINTPCGSDSLYAIQYIPEPSPLRPSETLTILANSSTYHPFLSSESKHLVTRWVGETFYLK